MKIYERPTLCSKNAFLFIFPALMDSHFIIAINMPYRISHHGAAVKKRDPLLRPRFPFLLQTERIARTFILDLKSLSPSSASFPLLTSDSMSRHNSRTVHPDPERDQGTE